MDLQICTRGRLNLVSWQMLFSVHHGVTVLHIFNTGWNDLVVAVPGGYLQRPSWCCETHLRKMTTSKRLVDHKSAKFQENVLKRGQVPETTVKKGNIYPVGPIVLGFIIFVVVGSAILQIFRTATSGGFSWVCGPEKSQVSKWELPQIEFLWEIWISPYLCLSIGDVLPGRLSRRITNSKDRDLHLQDTVMSVFTNTKPGNWLSSWYVQIVYREIHQKVFCSFWPSPFNDLIFSQHPVLDSLKFSSSSDYKLVVQTCKPINHISSGFGQT